MKINKKLAILALSVMVILPTGFVLANSKQEEYPTKSIQENYQDNEMRGYRNRRNFGENQLDNQNGEDSMMRDGSKMMSNFRM